VAVGTDDLTSRDLVLDLAECHSLAYDVSDVETLLTD